MRLRALASASFVGAALSCPGVPAGAEGLTLLAHAPMQPSPHPPLIVLLHGAGADERDMIGLWKDLPQTFVVVAPRAPFADPGGGYLWYRKDGARPRVGDIALSRKIVDLIVDSAVKRFDADPHRVFVGGFSQGAVMTYDIALHEPDRVRGGAVLSGLLFAVETQGLPDKAALARESFFIGHGTTDTRIPFAAATVARGKLEALGVPVAFHAYPGMGHGTGAAETRDLSVWLSERGAAPP